MSWLFGALAEGGVELPKSFDLKGIIGFLASLFGLTWTNIRNRIVKQIGEKAMGAVEKGVEIFKIISGPEGVGGLWQMLMEKLGDIKEMIFEQVKDFVQDRIITAGITWLIGLLNPAAAFIKACKLIYDVVMFFVNNASRIKKFVDTILDSVADIVRGNIGGVVNKINDVLGQMVPIIIGFLASVIGLGGIGAEDPRDRPEAAEAGQQGSRLRDQDRTQAGRADHPRSQGHQQQGQGQGRGRQGLGEGQGGGREGVGQEQSRGGEALGQGQVLPGGQAGRSGRWPARGPGGASARWLR